MLGQGKITEVVDRVVNLRDMLAVAAPEQHSSIVLRMVQSTIAKALGHDSAHHMDTTRHLEEFGIDSLTPVLVRNHLATMTDLTLPSNIALLHPNLQSLSEFLLFQLRDEIDSDSSSAPGGSATPKATTSGVSSDIQFNNVAKRNTASFDCPKTAFVIGPTGFVGAFMVREFLERGIIVYCLVRASSDIQAEERMLTNIKQYILWNPNYEPLLKTVVGDLSQPLLGLGEGLFDDLAN
ncbi:hypothetical protein P154DRAFT_571200 [Amniculicola lignicola CBS 123094]|uniref:Carrier domain-containing protein n=1 Tax=Amniculicola lignicola CBS 123094 TaxID=1392246 RepID=A0A6A5WUJ9_9PLEO|nr:hypothetical protein P154DRAFT_571200 [Amniculicola lignicola CBS 123094]